ncbi:hypothetical protein [Calycomorphotria hydatis]|uniref:DNA-directed RNA polymerase subunit P n=1 Tax=Calycomorphotria hydatis TaxID=2528027 RepID=A0A517TBK4_9PLAN|nr:hypothetical protein [Calycomorphotria hydatis]QDT65755.1 DNA-directed RNA polymerase subunit P [Calycomorphotria hydatis]
MPAETPPSLPEEKSSDSDENESFLELVEEGSTEKVGTTTDAGKGRIFPCEQCGADLTFHIGTQTMKCPFCSHEQQLELPEGEEIQEKDLLDMLEQLKKKHDSGEAAFEGFQEVTCDSCGGDVVFSGTLTSQECPYCASPIQIDRAHQVEHRIPVDGVLPFQITKKEAGDNLKKWVKSLWFAPTKFQRRGIQATFNGVYLPYWTFDSLTYTRYVGQRGDNYTVTVGSGKNRRTETRTRWSHASGKFQRFFDDVLVVAFRGIKRDLVRKLEPWPLKKMAPYNQQMLAGILARTYDIELKDGFRTGRERIEEALRADVRRRIGGDKQRIQDINTKYAKMTYKHLLLPVWLLAYRYQGKPYQVLINAATGEVQGERPWSVWKIVLTVLGVLFLLGLAYLAFALLSGGAAVGGVNSIDLLDNPGSNFQFRID